MAEIRGVQMPEPSSGGGGGLTNQLMGIFRERSRAQKQLELMAYQSAMNVAGHVAKSKLGAEAVSEAMQSHYERVHDPSLWKSEDARLMALGQLEKAGIRRMGPGIFESQSIGKVEYPTATKKSKATKRQDVPPGSVKKKLVQTEAPTVNEQPQTVTAPTVGDRTPRASKNKSFQPVLPTMGTAGKPIGVSKVSAPKAKKIRGAKRVGSVKPSNTPTVGEPNA